MDKNNTSIINNNNSRGQNRKGIFEMKKLSRITLATLAATTVIPQTMIVQAEETEDAIAAAQKELDDYKPIVQAAEQDAYGCKTIL